MKAILLAAALLLAGGEPEQECQIHYKDNLTGEQGALGWMPRSEADDLIRRWSKMVPTTTYNLVCRGEYRT